MADTRLLLTFLCHSVSSISLTLLNKQISKEIPFPLTIVLLQCLASVPFTLLVNVQLRQIRPIRFSHLPGASLLSLLFTLCLTSSLLGLGRVHVPMVVVGKNLGPFCTALLEMVFLQATLKKETLGSLLIGVVGSALYAVGDANTDLVGILLVGFNALLVAVAAVCEKHVVNTLDQAALGFSLYRSALAVPLLCAMLLCGLEDFGAAKSAIAGASSQTLSVLAVSTVFSSAAGLLVFTLQGCVSATTTQIASLVYKLATTLLSFMIFPEARKDIGFLAMLGYGLSTLSVTLYAMAPRQSKRKDA
eukprot:TRINITY_DN61369_c0_g1_i1.p1 TRINITY_DN61369_c0_g1~~TRINITY_DN61369_c0_g1_i1.p1  ORF type:complete len:304 (-),score=52.16 TRINITY_DN61369_c0_g1_i1:122-1033(-)